MSRVAVQLSPGFSVVGPPACGLIVAGAFSTVAGPDVDHHFVTSTMICIGTFDTSTVPFGLWFFTVATIVAVTVPLGVHTVDAFADVTTRSGM